MKKANKIMAIILAILMVVSIIPITASAEENATTYDYTVISEDEKTCQLNSCKGISLTEDKTIVFPSEVDGYKVIELADHITAYTNVRRVVVPDSVEKIGDAFNGNNGLYSITLGAGVSDFEPGNFSNMNELQEFIVSEDNPYICSIDGVVFTKDMSTILRFPTDWKYGPHYAIPDGVKTIAERAFLQPWTLDMLYIPDSVTVIEEHAISISDELSYIHFGNGIETIPSYAVTNCNWLTDVYIGSGVKTIEKYAFWGCERLNGVFVPENVTSLHELSFPDDYVDYTLKSICGYEGTYAETFAETTEGYSFRIEDRPTKEYEYTLNEDGTANFEHYNYRETKNIVIPSEIDGYEVTTADGRCIMGTVDYQDSFAESVISVTYPDTVKTILYDPTYGFFLQKANLSKAEVIDEECEVVFSATSSGFFKEFEVHKDSEYYSTIDGVLYSKDGKELLAYPGARTEPYYVPDGTETIGKYAFCDNHRVTEITLPETTSTIKDGAFLGTKILEKVYIPESVTSISPTAFYEAYEQDNTYPTIYGIEGSYAEEYAEKYNLKFVATVAGHVVEVIKGYAPTCTETGLTDGYKCSECGEILVQQKVISATGHNHEPFVTSPTCTEQGYTIYICACGDKFKDDYTSANGHEYNFAESEVKEATCTEGGYRYVQCLNCDFIFYFNIVDAKGHWYEDETVILPTCTEPGYIYSVCECGDVFEASVDALGHTEEKIPAVAPTCTETGLTAGTKCSECGETIKEQETVPAKGHKYTPVTTTPATHTSTGVMTYICNCGDRYTKVIEKIDTHNYKSVITAPTCTEQGYTTYTCSCGDSYVDNYVNATSHDYKPSVTAPTCTEKGYTTYTCECGDSYIDDYVDALGHTEETIPAVASTCTETGLTEGTRCSICDETLTEQEIIPANGHDYNDVVTVPTCTEQGYTTYTCECGDSYVDNYVDVLGHAPANTVEENYVAPTCTSNGSVDKVVYCSECKEEISRETETFEMLGHADNDGDGYCDTDNELLDPSVECDHRCHKNGLFWKITRFFNKLFGINKYCQCGEAHY